MGSFRLNRSDIDKDTANLKSVRLAATEIDFLRILMR